MPTSTTPSLVFEAHMQAELNADLEGTLATMVDHPHLLSMGSGMGGEGAAGVAEFYSSKLIGQFFPPDTEFITISRTETTERLIDELVVRFTHSEPIGHLLPGVAPTGRKVEVALVVIVGVREDKIAYEHIYWDQAGLLAQIGLLNPDGLPVAPDVARTLLSYTGKG